MLNLRKGTWTGICCLLALLLGSAPARSQTSFAEYSGFYTIVDDNTKAESLMRLEFLPGERDGFMLATVFGANGRYRVFAGPIFTQGGIPTVPVQAPRGRGALYLRLRVQRAGPHGLVRQGDPVAELRADRKINGSRPAAEVSPSLCCRGLLGITGLESDPKVSSCLPV